MKRSTYMLILAAAVVAVACTCIVLMEADDSDAARIRINPNGGTLTEDGSSINRLQINYTNSYSLTLPDTEFEYDGSTYVLSNAGYTLIGWSTTGTTTVQNGYDIGTTHTFGNNNYELYAIWARIQINPNNGTISYSGTSTTGSIYIGYIDYVPGSTFTVDGVEYTVSRNNYGLLGWSNSYNPTSATYVPGDGRTLSTSNNNRAVWGQGTFDVNRGTIYRNGTSTGDTSVTIPISYDSTAPGSSIVNNANTYTFVRTGYAFAGWATSSTATNPAYTYGDDLQQTNSSRTYYAVWKETTLTINPNGGTLKYTDGSSAGSTVVLDPTKMAKAPSTLFSVDGTKYIVSRTGYGLLGWATSSSATVPNTPSVRIYPHHPQRVTRSTPYGRRE